jgi:hypothetical protein
MQALSVSGKDAGVGERTRGAPTCINAIPSAIRIEVGQLLSIRSIPGSFFFQAGQNPLDSIPRRPADSSCSMTIAVRSVQLLT